MIKKQLQNLNWLRLSINQLESKLLEIDTELTRCTFQFDGMPKEKLNNSKNLQVELIDKKLVLQEAINNKLVKYYVELELIENKISQLTKKEEVLIRLRYISGLSWDEISKEMSYCCRHLHVIHNAAIKKLQNDFFNR